MRVWLCASKLMVASGPISANPQRMQQMSVCSSIWMRPVSQPQAMARGLLLLIAVAKCCETLVARGDEDLITVAVSRWPRRNICKDGDSVAGWMPWLITHRSPA
ncbi:hypothetical protein F5883DRAFT_585973 [Diaporthe sp. PMI_573]|nr:hypothetical protein F5883DRAFT_585973 [Diaporthaceae sp. PMI_573]